MAQKKQVRLSDIADKLKISTVTVSKALSNKDGVGDELRTQIKELAKEMGYKTKPASDSFGNTTGNIGVIIPSKFFSPEVSYYWYLFTHLSTELLKRNFFTMMELVSTEDENTGRLPRLLTENKVDGLILLGQVSTAYIQKAATLTDNFILMDFYTEQPDYDCVVCDDFYNSYLITSYLIEHGHKTLRFVGNFEATTSIRDRFMGFQKGMYEHGFLCNKNDIIPDRDNTGLLLNKMPLSKTDISGEYPDAFVCNCDLTASKVIAQLTTEGMTVPNDVSVTGYDNFLAPAEKTVPLTTIGVEPQSLCAMAAELIINKITGKEYIKGRHLATGKIIERDSVKRLSGQAR